MLFPLKTASIVQSLPLLSSLIIYRNLAQFDRTDMNGPRSIALPPANSCLWANRYPVTCILMATTLASGDCKSAEQAGLRWGSTVRQQERGSCQRYFLQMHQYLLNDHRIFYAGNDPGWSSTDSAPLNINLENPLQPLRPGHGRMTLNWRLLLLAIHCFGLVAFSPLRRCHQRMVLAVRGEYTVETCQIDSGPGHKSCQFGDEIHRLEDDVGGSIPIRRLQLIANIAVFRQ